MPGQNDFKAFAAGAGANAMAPAAWGALTALLAGGFQAGTASSAQINTVLRQVSTVAAAIGKVIADANINAVDNGDVAALAASLITALRSSFDPVESVVHGTVGPLPSEPSTTGYIQLSSGHLIQFGSGFVPASAGTSGVLLSFPVTFPSRCYQIVATDYGSGVPAIGVSQQSAAQFRAWARDGTSGTYQDAYFRYIAIGR